MTLTRGATVRPSAGRVALLKGADPAKLAELREYRTTVDDVEHDDATGDRVLVDGRWWPMAGWQAVDSCVGVAIVAGVATIVEAGQAPATDLIDNDLERDIFVHDSKAYEAVFWGSDCDACEGNTTPHSGICDSCGNAETHHLFRLVRATDADGVDQADALTTMAKYAAALEALLGELGADDLARAIAADHGFEP